MIQTPPRLSMMRTMAESFTMEIMMAELKKHLSLDEQVDRLESRGLIIPSRELAKEFLFNNNYYRFTGYLHGFRKARPIYYVFTTIDGIDLPRFAIFTSLGVFSKVLGLVQKARKKSQTSAYCWIYGGLFSSDKNSFCVPRQYMQKPDG